MAFDEGGVYYAFGGTEDAGDRPVRDTDEIANEFKQFIVSFFKHSHVGQGQDMYKYRSELHKNRDFLNVDLVDVKDFNPRLGANLEERPSEYLPLFERAAKQVLKEDHCFTPEGEEFNPGDVQVMLHSTDPFGPQSLRELASDCVNKLVQLPGIITAASRPKHKASYLTIQCKYCRAIERVPVRPGLQGALIPTRCNTYDGSIPGQEKCPPNSYVVGGDRCNYVDQQQLKLQERPEDIPTGELPRTMMLIADRQLVNRATPGTRVVVTGIYCTHRSKVMDKGSSVTLQQPYLRVVAMHEESEGHKDSDFSAKEVAKFNGWAMRGEELIEVIKNSIAPKICGHEDIKLAVACLLFGGCRKVMPDATTRRGDINVLLLGDPSTAKSQFLKFVDKVAPICVYTSGKGSSAAGLTAAVVQEPGTREFYLEGGAMVLADGGVVCIDEFDKMRTEDRVAIHEAMEQQTISIAKAGITTVLKSRTSVLAAANPPSGRYDDLQSASDNIDLQSTILSRFDLIFVVRDIADTATDNRIADFVLNTHKEAGRAGAQAAAAAGNNSSSSDILDDKDLKRYIHYCRCKSFPRLSESAAQRLANEYVNLRSQARDDRKKDDGEENPIPITVRQLEALVRISEALARMCLCNEASESHVERAIDLFRKSTGNARKAGLMTVANPEYTLQAESLIKDHIPINGFIGFKKLMEILTTKGISAQAGALAVRALVDKQTLRRRQEGKLLQRVQ